MNTMNEFNEFNEFNDFPQRSSSGVRQPIALSRRQLLQLLGLGGASSALGLAGCRSNSRDAAITSETSVVSASKTSSAKSTSKAAGTASAKAADTKNQRTLVVIELQGGHDGFAMLVPYGDGRFRKLRDRIWVDPKELHIVDDRYALAKGLAPVADQLAFIEGVGVAKPDLSHFAMLQRWWTGDPDGTLALNTGFLGRCCDVLAGSEPVTGMSIGGGSAPALITNKATTVSLPHLDAVRELMKEEPEQRRMREALRVVAHGSGGGSNGGSKGKDRDGIGVADTDAWLTMARSGLRAALDLSGMVGQVSDLPKSYPEGNDLAVSLGAIRQLISAGSGVKVFHVPWGSFDTHTNEVGTHTDHMNRLGIALAAFRDDLAAHGLSDRVLVATTSEFGRRPEANAGGTDHGTASSMLLMGPTRLGRHGKPVDFSRLDESGNVKATVSMADYQATLAQWLGARPSDVLASPGTVIDTLGLAPLRD